MGIGHDIRGFANGIVRTIRQRWRSLLALEALLKLASILVLVPLTAVLLSALLSRGGADAVENKAIIKFVSSVPGVLTLLLMPAITLAISFFEQACILWLLNDLQSSVQASLAATLARLPRLAELAILQVTIVIGVLLPFVVIAGGVYWLLLSDSDINFYLANRPPRFITALTIGGVLAIVAGLLLLRLWIRWFIAVPILLFEDVGPLEAMRTSSERSRSRLWVVVTTIALWLLLRLCGTSIVTAALWLLTNFAFSVTEHSLTAVVWATASLLILNVVALAIAAALDRVVYTAAVRQVYGEKDQEGGRENAGHMTANRSRLRRLGLIGAFGLATLGAGIYACFTADRLLVRQEVVVTAHRAGPLRAPENSLAALRLAIAEGADAAEIDVQLSADGTVVVIHDRDLRRLADLPLVIRDASDAQLREADIGRLRGVDFAGERIATLEQFIDEARGRIGLCVELKYYGPEPRLAERVLKILRDKGIADRAAIISLEYAALKQVRQLDPKIRLGCLVSASVGDVTKLDVDFLSLRKTLLTPRLRTRADERGLKLAVWTVDDRNEMIRLMLAGADEIVTNDSALAVEAVRAYEDLSDVELILLRLQQFLSR